MIFFAVIIFCLKKNNLYKKEIRLITFILSIIWIVLGIRQYLVLSNWGKDTLNSKNSKKR